MLWGRNSILKPIEQSNFTSLLGFNEPDHAQQSNMLPAEAAALWPKLEETARDHGVRTLVSPAASAGHLEWYDEFFGNCSRCRIDALATHDYSCAALEQQAEFVEAERFDELARVAARGLQSQLKLLHARYHLPIWLTEFNCGDGGRKADPAVHLAYMKKVLPYLDSAEEVARYAWFSIHPNVAHGASLVKHGALTKLGVYYNSVVDADDIL